MTTEDVEPGAGHPGDDQDDMDARFAAIVATLTDVSWSGPETVVSAGPGAPGNGAPQSGRIEVAPDGDRTETLDDRDRRRAQRRAERAAEVAAFAAEQDRMAAETHADDEHFVPPDPPPLPRPRRRTVGALLLLALGILALARPQLLQIAPDAVLIFGLVLVLSGLGLLAANLRPRATDPGDGTGWDDGARL